MINRRKPVTNNNVSLYKEADHVGSTPRITPLMLDDLTQSQANLNETVSNNKSPISHEQSKEEHSTSSEDYKAPSSIGTFSDSSGRSSKEGLTGMDAVRHAYLGDKKNHFLKCTMLTLASKKKKRAIEQSSDGMVKF